MKVLILTTVMAPYRVQLFNEIGKKCELCVCFEQKKSSARDEKWYDNDALNFKLIPLKGWEKSVKSIKGDIIKKVKAFNPDIAIAYEYSTATAMLFMSICKLKKIPYIINCDGGFITKSYKDTAKKFFIKRAYALIASGEMAKNYFKHYGGCEKKIHFNNFTSLHEEDILKKVPSSEEKRFYRQKKGITEDKVIITVGQFIHRKGFDVLLNSLLGIDKSIGVYFIGGKPTAEYISFVEEHKLTNVHFIDFMRPEQLREYFVASDVFVLPTREDVWGLVINEAMAYGLPVVTTNRCIAGIELVKDDVNGYVVPVEDSVALSNALNKVLLDDDLLNQMATNNISTIQSYTYEVSAEMIFETIKSVFERA